MGEACNVVERLPDGLAIVDELVEASGESVLDLVVDPPVEVV